jgi:hypothetical protein
MRHLQLALALLVLLGIGLALYLERPEPPDSSLFGAEMALTPELAPLVMPGGTLELRGRVHDTDGRPTSDAFLALLRAEDDASQAEPLYHAYTDGEGRFELAGLEAGTFRVLLTHPSAPPKSFALVLPVAGEVSWELAAPLPPLPVLPELRRSSLAGRLGMPEAFGAGAPSALQGFEVVLRPRPDTPLLAGACERRATSGAAGEFALGELVVAHYEVEVLPPWARGGSWPVLARGALAAEAGRAGTLELLLVVGALAGELQEADGRPLAGALVKVSALDARDPVGQAQLWPPAVTDPAGSYRVELLPPGRYLVHLRAGSAAHDIEVVVQAGLVTAVPHATLDPRARPGG